MTARKDRPVIEVKHLSKQYHIGMDRTYKRFTESFMNAVCHPIRTIWEATRPKDTFWALKDLNFEVERGEVIGIIGKNGAGKSTLLKILSRITYPTEGEVIMRGRVGSLLEVGTGFHPELTGRENIYFNGAILGMKKREIDDKFDEIVRFSGVEKFLDTPVKRYSSGMQVRLAFSVAAHLDPEILLVDEVLAVGDAQFQKKCLGKMKEVSESGRTVLFVSHNMGAIEHLCARTLLLDKGQIITDDVTENTIRVYMQLGYQLRRQDLSDFSRRIGSGEVRITKISLRNKNDQEISVAKCGEPLKIVLGFMKLSQEFNQNIYVSISCKTIMGESVFLQHNRMAGVDFVDLPENGEFICEIDNLNLIPSTYSLSVTILVGYDYVDRIEDAFELTVESGNYLGRGEIPPPSFGPCLMKAKWSVVNEL